MFSKSMPVLIDSLCFRRRGKSSWIGLSLSTNSCALWSKCTLRNFPIKTSYISITSLVQKCTLGKCFRTIKFGPRLGYFSSASSRSLHPRLKDLKRYAALGADMRDPRYGSARTVDFSSTSQVLHVRDWTNRSPRRWHTRPAHSRAL